MWLYYIVFMNYCYNKKSSYPSIEIEVKLKRIQYKEINNMRVTKHAILRYLNSIYL